jgi:two-component system, NarL family, response regulator LiaR
VGAEPPRSAPAEPTRLLIVDDHDVVRSGLRYMLSGEPDLEVVGEARDGAQAVELCRGLGPDVVLMDVSMPGADGIEATRAIKGEHPGVAVVMLTVHDSPDYLLEALRAGACGYVLKDAPRGAVLGAVRQARDGGAPLDPRLTARLARQLADEGRGAPNRPAGTQNGRAGTATEPLTAREVEVLRLLARGRTNRQIARDLMFSVHTVKAHVRRILAKLGASDRTEAAVRAMELGLLGPIPGETLGPPRGPEK